MFIRGFTKFEITVACGLKFHWFLRTLNLKFQKARTKIDVFLSLPCWLSQLNWDSQQGRDRKTSILVLAFWNFKFKVLKCQWNIRPHATVISKFVKPLSNIPQDCWVGKVPPHGNWFWNQSFLLLAKFFWSDRHRKLLFRKIRRRFQPANNIIVFWVKKF